MALKCQEEKLPYYRRMGEDGRRLMKLHISVFSPWCRTLMVIRQIYFLHEHDNRLNNALSAKSTFAVRGSEMEPSLVKSHQGQRLWQGTRQYFCCVYLWCVRTVGIWNLGQTLVRAKGEEYLWVMVALNGLRPGVNTQKLKKKKILSNI